MKSFRSILLIIAFLPSFEMNAQTCFGDFTTTVSGATVQYNGTVSLNVTNIIWDFGDGNFDYSNSINPSHTYATAGTYTTCIAVYDSLQSCFDSTCHPVVIDSCFGSFTYYVNALSGNFFGYANGGGPNAVYAWNFGDNTTSSVQNPTHIYANPGTYTVCFAYYDLVTGCADSTCMSIYFGACTADFMTVDSLGYTYFINSSTLGNAGSYYWDFGDGNYSTQQYPSNVYAQPGIYLVCLTAYDSMQNFCDSTCHYLNITNVASMNENIFQLSQITVVPNPVDESATISFIINQSTEAIISVYDISGREICNPIKEHFSTGKQVKQIDTKSMNSGTYLIQINANGQISNCKMFVTHKI